MTLLPASPIRLFHNDCVNPAEAYGPAREAQLGGRRFSAARDEITRWPDYAITPLIILRGLSASAGIETIYYKDESTRFGLGSFKALGGAYALLCLLTREIERRSGARAVQTSDLLAGKYRGITSDITVTCATDGNHGRSVAWGASLFGCRCVIYVHETVSDQRVAAISAYGAEVRRNPGNYDDAVRRAAANAAENGWFVISDTSYEGYTDVPQNVMQGYALMVDEALKQLPAGESPTHVFVQAGVGGLAAAVCGHLWERLGARRPRFVVVEPMNAACLYESARHGFITPVHGGLETMMAGLACGEPSLIAWRTLSAGADYFMTIEDEPVAECMRMLAAGVGDDTPIVVGESGVAGLAGMLLALQQREHRATLDLGSLSRILVFGTEGETDPQLYRRIVGRDAADVRRAATAWRERCFAKVNT
jgi:diaminopropionate ammonia-lyase